MEKDRLNPVDRALPPKDMYIKRPKNTREVEHHIKSSGMAALFDYEDEPTDKKVTKLI